MNTISNELKKEWLKRKAAGESSSSIYESIPEGVTNASCETFARMLRKWAHKFELDDDILDGANLKFKFTPYASSVHVDANGNVTGAWIKQTADAEGYNKLLEAIENTKLPTLLPVTVGASPKPLLLEIPLFDMHFGIADMDYYNDVLVRVLEIIEQAFYEQIVIVVGQDLLHNDDFRGRTAKGTQIEAVDMAKAWDDAETFFINVINSAQNHASSVKVMFSHGNHDESMSWAFTKLLERVFPEIEFDTAKLPRKAINWRRNFIGWTHGEYAKSRAEDLFAQFAVEFPKEFADARIREIHTGHLHREGSVDVGAMVRRLPTAGKTDAWSREQGFVGAHKRFTLYVYEPERLKTVHYV